MEYKAKVLFLLDNSYLPDSRVENEINALLEAGYAIDLYCVEDINLPSFEQKKGLRIFREISNSIHRPLSGAYRSFAKEFIDKIALLDIDVIHCHDFRMFFLGCEIKERNPKIILIYDSHEYLAGYPYYRRSESLKAILKGFFIWNYYNFKEKRNIQNADYIITVSTTLKDLLVKSSGKPGIVVRNFPPNGDKCTGHCRYWHETYGLAEDVKVIIHTGNAQFAANRRLFLLESIEANPKLALVFLGSNSTLDKMKDLVAKMNFKQIYFHHKVDRAEITKYCSQADIGLVYTWNKKWKSYWYALPNKMMDVSLAGLPVLSTEQPELKKFVDIFQHGITFNGDHKSHLEKAIQLMLSKHQLLRANAQKIQGKVNWKNESQKLIDLYNTALKP